MHQGTRDTYNQSASLLSQHYDSIGSRDGDISLAFTIAGHPQNAHVLELGCGNGREARAILKYTPFYIGIDTSEQMIAIAREKVPKGTFEVADANTFDYGGPNDIIFAFALFRHLNLSEIATVLKKAADSLRPGGVLYLSSMYAKNFQQVSKQDSFGTREMYYYNPDIIQKHAPPSLKKVQEIYDIIDDVEWFELVLQRTAD